MQLFKRFGFWGLAALLALACYLPVLTTEFGVHNDYSIWQYEKSSVIFDFPESPHLAAIGRPLGAILLNLHFYPIQKISDFTISRWVAFSLVLLSSLLMARQLERRVHVPPGLAACTAMCVFLLPSSELFVYWSTNLVPGALNVLLALLIYEALDKVPFAGWRSGGALSRGKIIAWLLLAALLFLCSMCIYPPTTMFILVPTFACLVFSPIEHWPQTRRRIVRDVAFVMAGCAGYFLLTRYCLRPILARHFPPIQATIAWTQTGHYRFSVERNVLALLANFWKELSAGLMGFWYPLFEQSGSYEKVAGIIAGILVLLGLWRLVRKPSTSAIGPWVQRRYRLQAGVAMLGLLALSECPVILAAGVTQWAPFRVIYPISAMVLLLMFSLAGQVRLPAPVPAMVARPLPVMILIAAAVLGHWVLGTAAANAHTELSYFREQLARLDLKAVKGLTIIGPQNSIHYAPGPLRTEFKLVATKDNYVSGFPQALLEERAVKRESLPVQQWFYNPGDEYSVVAADTAVIDMNFAVRGQPEPWPPRKPRAVIRASGQSSTAGATLHAFDCNPKSFWEAHGPNNWLQVDYGGAYELAEYSLVPINPPERMPCHWQLLGSSDGVRWTLLEERREESSWVSGEERRFSLPAPARYSSYRLVFPTVRADFIRIADWKLNHADSDRVALDPD